MRNTTIALLASLLAVVAALTVTLGGPHLPFDFSEASHPPPSAPVAESFSVSDGDPLTTTGVHPADILIAGPTVAIPCSNLGLWCTDPGSGAKDDLIGLAYDYDFLTIDLPPIEFSVAPGSTGTPASEVRVEANCSPAEPQADVFETALAGANIQDVDGNGVACSTNAGLGLGLDEASPGLDNIDALERAPELFVDLDQDSIPEAPVYMTLAPASPSLTAFGATPRDILMTVGAADPVVWASGAALGLVSGDVIDAICVDDGGNGVYNAGVDRVLFSLAPGSPTLTTLSAGAADLLRAGPAVNYSASRLGLQATDDVDALKCPTNDRDGDTFFDIADNCPDTNSFDQTDTDSDGLGNVCDSDDDNDGVADAAEGPCGSDPLDITPPLSRPERLDGAFATVDDDGDTMVDEPLPVGAANFDCDGDGYRGDGPGAGNISEKRIYTAAGTANDQDPCGNTGWPADLTSAGPSANRITLTDLTSFIAPLPRHFNTDPGDAGYDVRWDLVTGNGAAPPKDISLTDLTNLTTLFPPMLGSAKAFGGPVCPWPP